MVGEAPMSLPRSIHSATNCVKKGKENTHAHLFVHVSRRLPKKWIILFASWKSSYVAGGQSGRETFHLILFDSFWSLNHVNLLSIQKLSKALLPWYTRITLPHQRRIYTSCFLCMGGLCNLLNS